MGKSSCSAAEVSVITKYYSLKAPNRGSFALPRRLVFDEPGTRSGWTQEANSVIPVSPGDGQHNRGAPQQPRQGDLDGFYLASLRNPFQQPAGHASCSQREPRDER